MKKIVVLIFLVFVFSLEMFGENKVVYLTSLEWPPYTGEKIGFQGASALVAQKAFAAMGYDLRIDFFPWERAVRTAEEDSKYLGYFPEYYSKDTEKTFVFSDPMGEGPIGFVERKSSPIKWNTLQDLKKYEIGVVNGYINTEEFDKMVEKKELKVEVVNDDLTNIKKVAAERIDTAVIDVNVFEYFLKSETSLAALKGKVQFNAKPLENKKLYVCFKKSSDGEKMAKIYNEGLKKIDVNKIMKEYFEINRFKSK